MQIKSKNKIIGVNVGGVMQQRAAVIYDGNYR